MIRRRALAYTVLIVLFAWSMSSLLRRIPQITRQLAAAPASLSAASHASRNMSLSAGGKDRPTESVWDYPRPPALEPTQDRLQVIWKSPAGEETTLVDTTKAYRVLETSHPPTCECAVCRLGS